MDDANEPRKTHATPHGSHSRGKSQPESKTEKESISEEVVLFRKDFEELQERLKKAEDGCSSNLDGWQRERAEFSNYKKRIDRDQVTLSQSITGTVIKKYLPVMDDLDLALKSRPKEGDGAAWASGIELIQRKLMNILESEGVTPISENKVQFDPTIHEAVTHEDNADFDSGEVIEVIRNGYKLGDRILRPAVVRVAR